MHEHRHQTPRASRVYDRPSSLLWGASAARISSGTTCMLFVSVQNAWACMFVQVIWHKAIFQRNLGADGHLAYMEKQ